MKRKNVISGAVIVAAGMSAAADNVSAAHVPAEGAKPAVSADRATFDMIKLDDDVINLGGISSELGEAWRRDGSDRAEEKIYLGQTWGGGVGNDGVARGNLARVPGATPRVVIDPRTNRSKTILFNKRSRTYFDAKSGKQMKPPTWMRKQLEK